MSPSGTMSWQRSVFGCCKRTRRLRRVRLFVGITTLVISGLFIIASCVRLRSLSSVFTGHEKLSASSTTTCDVGRGASPQKNPFTFLPRFRNPCWYNSTINGQLECLPFFYLAGFPKCGTTDVFERISVHKHVLKPGYKEPHWITRLRYQGYNFNNYTRFFASPIENLIKSNASISGGYNPYIVGDGSASTFWDNNKWPLTPGNENCMEPGIINADYIRSLNPSVKVIIIVRNPAIRVFSDYVYFQVPNTSTPRPEDFHEKIVKQIVLLRTCFKTHSLRHCVYNESLNTVARVNIGIYYIYLEDWYQRFPRDQIHVLRLEDLRDNVTLQMRRIFQFLGLEMPDTKTMDLIKGMAVSNKGKSAAMLNKTKLILDNFYRPYNRRLAQIMKEKRYSWDSV
ncbi:carbohydrate sulfotransferase 15-like isoform X1 [Pomacea canaliculata]|uniref:carbohydrate sulfotransferase 15-like isoform X1 n=1 Tax=Pomacea canaliculata TaxID=400727 RepID=UPI000D72B101|nr:carbohydrate sulfotransferase 15-like isoform X1 [Pomacea canaliculata]